MFGVILCGVFKSFAVQTHLPAGFFQHLYQGACCLLYVSSLKILEDHPLGGVRNMFVL